MVASGLGLTFLPEMAVEVESRRAPEVTVLPLEGDAPARDIALAHRPGSPRKRELELLADMLRFDPQLTAG
jgi:LysR family hydrogen peroxide-inducible transcriptional activator